MGGASLRDLQSFDTQPIENFLINLAYVFALFEPLLLVTKKLQFAVQKIDKD